MNVVKTFADNVCWTSKWNAVKRPEEVVRQRSGNVFWTFRQSHLNVQAKSSKRSVNVIWTLSERLLNVKMKLLLNVQGTLSDNVQIMFSECSKDFVWMSSECSDNILGSFRWQHRQRQNEHPINVCRSSDNVAWTFSECTVTIHWLFRERALNV